MERYFTPTKSILRAGTTSNEKKRYQPYAKPAAAAQLTSSQITKVICKTLKDEQNPICHSDIYERLEHYHTFASGHQRYDGPRGSEKLYQEYRSAKIEAQQEEALADTPSEPQVLRNVKAYINGFLEITTDLEMKRTIKLHGGAPLMTPSGATHILTSMPLSAAKTQKFLTSKARNVVHVVKPEWVTDSIKAGKRLPERNYAIVNNKGNRNLAEMLQK